MLKIVFLSFLICSAFSFTIRNELNEAGISITPDILKRIMDTCDLAYSFFRYDVQSNAKYIADALRVQLALNNWDVIVSARHSHDSGFSGHSINQTWWVYLHGGQIKVNDYSYFIMRNFADNSTLVNISSSLGNAHGKAVNDSSLQIIQNIIRTCTEQKIQEKDRAICMQSRVQIFFGGKWAAVSAQYNNFAGYVSVCEDWWVTYYFTIDYFQNFAVYKVSN